MENDESSEEENVAEIPGADPTESNQNDPESRLNDPKLTDPETTPPTPFAEETSKPANDRLDGSVVREEQ